MKRDILWVALIILLIGCDKDEEYIIVNKSTDEIQVEEPLDQKELDTYVQKFLDEAEKRGVNSDNSISDLLDKLTISFVENQNDYCGYAHNFGKSFDPWVTISTRDLCWRDQPGASREALIFHELGHAILQRAHLNNKLPNGFYKSLMNEEFIIGLYKADSKERTYYIDELFDIGVEVPDWAK